MSDYNHHLSGGTTIYPEHMQQIQQVLAELVAQISGVFVLVSDHAGQNIASDGKTGNANLVTLGALIASDMAASQEIARVAGDNSKAKIILHEGPDFYQFIAEAGDSLVLFARVPADTPLGLSRNFIRQAAGNIGEVVRASRTKQGAVLPNSVDDTRFKEEVSNAFEDLWSR